MDSATLQENGKLVEVTFQQSEVVCKQLVCMYWLPNVIWTVNIALFMQLKFLCGLTVSGTLTLKQKT